MTQASPAYQSTATITAIGSYLPERADLEQLVDTSHEWIVQRTGIDFRYHLRLSNSRVNPHASHRMRHRAELALSKKIYYSSSCHSKTQILDAKMPRSALIEACWVMK